MINLPAPASQWKPVRRGRRYCSPGCGHGCTHKDYLSKKAAAAALCKQLGKGWKINLFDNLGWHYEAVHTETGMTVSKHGSKRYWASTEIGADKNQFHCEAETPVTAVRAVLQEMDKERDRIIQHMNALAAFCN